MSKAPAGPAATSFVNPRKTGWLYKHGGSGLSSHWKKRWFIADDHYLFYYKGPNDKRPVGILCLSEYGSCEKASVKEWKKPFSFILGRVEGNQENSDSATGKDYVLYSDSEGDMNTWIKALQEEMKSSGPNGGHSGSSKVQVDQKALEEVTKAASDGPKLTHLTTQRPRVRGRRPPKRYATYHEDDKDDSPPDTPTSERKGSTTPPHPSSPLSTASPTSQKKGHRPAVPLMPKHRSSTSSSPPLSDSSRSSKKQPPLPPSKPIPEIEGGIVAESGPTSKQRPMPPKRPLKPRATTDVPLQAPRPIPVPRKAGKDVTKLPLEEMPTEVKDKNPAIKKENFSGPTNLHTDEPDEDLRDVHVPDIIDRQGIDEEKTEQKTELVPIKHELLIANTDTVSEKRSTSLQEAVADTDSRPIEQARDHIPQSPNVSSADEYEHMTPGVTKDNSNEGIKSSEYDKPGEWNSNNLPVIHKQKKEVEYAVPTPVLKQVENTYDVPISTENPNINSVHSTPQIPVVPATNEEHLTTGRGKSPSPPSSVENHLKPFQIERDALGYSKVMKKRDNDVCVRSESPVVSDDEPPPPPLWIGMDKGLMTDDVPSTLQQSREILRLAQIMKREVEEMRREVQKELEMARRERQDAELLKKNATEILRMAKEKLNRKPPA